MPRQLENDRWLFGVTLALCLLGAVMIFSASAVTAEHQYGRPYIFLVRQAAWLVLGLVGMFALMRTDYRRLREPAVVCTAVCVVLLMLVGTFFLDKSHATHRWIKFGPIGIQPSELAKLAVILYLAWFLDHEAAQPPRRWNSARRIFSRRFFPPSGPILIFVMLIVAATGSRHVGGHRPHRHGDSVCRGLVVEMAARRRRRSAARVSIC